MNDNSTATKCKLDQKSWITTVPCHAIQLGHFPVTGKETMIKILMSDQFAISPCKHFLAAQLHVVDLNG